MRGLGLICLPDPWTPIQDRAQFYFLQTPRAQHILNIH